MRRVLLGAILVLALAACGEDEIKGKEAVPTDAGVPGNVYEVEVNGMPCVIWLDKRGEGNASWSYSGIDCDWRER